MDQPDAMRLWVVILHPDDGAAVLPALLDAGVEAHAVTSAGAFLQRANMTLLVAVRAEQDMFVRTLLAAHAHTRTEERTAGLSETAADALRELAPEPLAITVAGAVILRLPLIRWESW